MATQVQWRGGSTAEHSTFTGAAREVTVDTQKKTLVVHDGSTAGGEPLLREDQANLPTSVTNGISVPSANNVAISTNGTGRLFVDASGNVGVGATSPNQDLTISSGADKLHLFGSTAGNGGALFATNSGYTDYEPVGVTGEYISFSTRTGALTSTERLRITSDGKLGLGTSAPKTQLNIAASTGPVLTLESTDSTLTTNDVFGQIDFYANDGSTNGTGAKCNIKAIATSTAGTATALTFSTADSGTATGTEKVRIDASGNVGIGTTSPSAALDVVGQVKASVLFNANGEGFIRGDAVGELRFQAGTSGVTFWNNSNNTEHARIDSSGRLLVGTSSAYLDNVFGGTSYRGILQVARNEFDLTAQFHNWTNSTGMDTRGGTCIALSRSKSGALGTHTALSSGNDIAGFIFNASDGSAFQTAASIVAAADGAHSSGDVPGRLVFSSTPSGSATPVERMRINSTGTVCTANGLTIGSLGDAGSDKLAIASAVIASGAGNSTLKYSTSTGIVTYDTSSRLVKENIVDCPYGIDAVKLLQPRKYFRTDDQRDEIGFVADELVDVLPEFVPIGPKSVITKNEEDTEDIPLGVNYEKLTAVLTKALQEAIGRIESLEAEVAALKAS
jgi:hypothetical protein